MSELLLEKRKVSPLAAMLNLEKVGHDLISETSVRPIAFVKAFFFDGEEIDADFVEPTEDGVWPYLYILTTDAG
jgi:hypothetical protein